MRRAGVVVAAVAILGALATFAPLPEPVELPPGGVDILDRQGRLLYQVIDPQRGGSRPVPLGDIPPSLVAATIATEDASFATNPGIDLFATLRALAQDIHRGRIVAGGSTITQQLAKLRYVQADERASHSIQRKLLESWIALRLTATLGKDHVLEQYLNSAPYGNLAVGAEAAAWAYFGKPARELSLAESALLAGLPQSPSVYDPFTRFDAAHARQGAVLKLMERRGFISDVDAEAARRQPLHLNDRPFPLSAAHFVDYVRSLAPPGATRIRTTLDRDIQSMAERAAKRQVARLADHTVTDAAVVVLDPHSGEVLAMVGGVDYFDARQPGAQVNMAVAPRQPGSAFKPITYAAALESGRFSEASILDDSRTVFRTRQGAVYIPEDYDHQFHGAVPLRVALGSSLNVPAVQVESAVGVERVVGLARSMGLALADSGQFDLSLTLGGAEVRLLDLTAAYAAFAAGGLFHPPAVLRDVAAQMPHRVISEQTAWLIDDMLSDDAARGPGFGRDGVLHVPGRSVGVKTGTTSDFRDNWTIGYTPDVVVGVWVGNADNRPMRDVSGVSGAAPLWRDVLGALLDGTPARQFERPTGLTQVSLCATSEAPAGAACPWQRLEWLRASDMPLKASAAQRPRIVFPHPDMVIALDANLRMSVQRLPIEVDSPVPVTVTVDGVPLGVAPLVWMPTPGHHVIGAADGQDIEIDVVRSGAERLP